MRRPELPNSLYKRQSWCRPRYHVFNVPYLLEAIVFRAIPHRGSGWVDIEYIYDAVIEDLKQGLERNLFGYHSNAAHWQTHWPSAASDLKDHIRAVLKGLVEGRVLAIKKTPVPKWDPKEPWERWQRGPADRSFLFHLNRISPLARRLMEECPANPLLLLAGAADETAAS